MRSIHQVIPVGGGEGEGDSRTQEEESRGFRDVGEGEGQRFEDDDEESRVAEDTSGGNGRGATSHLICTQRQVPPPLPAPPQQLLPPGSSVHWERFLPIGSLKVLLVENDDCTRQVVSALLRNCSYEA